MPSKRYLSAIIFIVSLLAFSKGYADHPTTIFDVGVGGPIWAVSPATLPQGSWAVGLQAEYLNLKPLSDNELKTIATNTGEHVDSEDYLFAPSLNISYGITNTVAVGASVPYLKRANIRESEFEDGKAEMHIHGDSKGIGDATLFAKWRFFDSKQYGISVAATAGVNTPTGTTHARDNDGQRFETEHQPGTGAWRPFTGLSVGADLNNRFAVVGNVIYTLSTEGAQKTDIGDLFNYNLAAVYRVVQSASRKYTVDGILELNGEYRQKLKEDGEKDNNTGGSIIYLSPGIKVSSDAGWSVFSSVGLPVYQKLNGHQADVNLLVLLGISYSF